MSETRYGDDRTIHGTRHLHVEVDKDGKVVGVWFRCLALPFEQVTADAERAASMRAMYRKAPPPIRAIVYEAEESMKGPAGGDPGDRGRPPGVL